MIRVLDAVRYCDTGVMNVLKKALKGSTTTVLEHSFPKIVHRDATTMADELQLSLPMSWIHQNQYQAAWELASNQSKRIIATDTTTFFVLTKSGLKMHKKITVALVNRCVSESCDDVSNLYRPYRIPTDLRIETCIARIRYTALDEGERPRGIKKFEKLVDICKAIVKVKVAEDPASICPCEANPYDLFCPCKGARKTGICYHILGVTHCIMKALPREEQHTICNVKYMATLIDGKPKKGHRRKKKNPWGHCLQRDDSDEEEDDDVPPPLALQWS